MNFIKHRLIFYFVFFKSIGIPAFAIGIALGWLGRISSSSPAPASVDQLIGHMLQFFPLGVVFGLVWKEIGEKEQYYFYYNQGISKVELWVVSILSSFSFFYLFNLIVSLWKNIWKWIA